MGVEIGAEADDVDGYTPASLLARLRTEALGGGPKERPNALPISAIGRLPELFQPRRTKEDERHIGELARALRSTGKLDPVLVMYVGATPYLIDGHHRLAAYEAEEIAGPIPVDYFRGSLEEAILEAGRQNTKAKLPMSTFERQNFAWRLVLLGEYSKKQTVEAAGVSDGQVAIMRRVKLKLGEAAYGCPYWFAALRQSQGDDQREWTDEDRQEWRDRRADWLVEQIAKSCGPKFTDDPEVAAMALDRLFGRRIVELAVQLSHYVPEDDPDDPDADF